MKRLLLVLSLAAVSTAAQAQLGVYAGYTAAKLNVANTGYIYGPTFGAYIDSQRLPVLRFGVDIRGSVIHSSSTTRVTNGLVGPRIAAQLPALGLKPYAEGLLGISHNQYGQGVATTDETAAAYGIALGTDLRVLPYLDWRVLDFTYTRLQSTTSTAQKTFTTGLVFRIPLS